MPNENGVGQSLVVYARRGTAEILRQRHMVSVDSLTHETIHGSIVFTAKGRNGKGRTEVATGAKYIDSLTGKAKDNAIMTASTRALRRLTMQFTGLGILDESEVHAVEPSLVNPASAVQLAPAAPLPTVQPLSAPGKVVELPPANTAPAVTAAPPEVPTHNFASQYIAEATAFLNAKADKKADQSAPVSEVKPAESTTSSAPEAAIEAAAKPARKPRKARNTVTLGDVEPETVSTQVNDAVPTQAYSVAQNPPNKGVSLQDSAGKIVPAATQVVPTVTRSTQPDVTPTPAPAPAPAAQTASDFAGKPTDVQMAEYRKRVSVFTSELPSSENMGSVQKMRAFITKMSGTAPQFMTTEQWEEQLSWFDSFVERNKIKGLVKYINDSLNVS
jgi:hypothetical protein